MSEIYYLDGPNPLLKVLFPLFSVALPNHYAWRSRLEVDRTIKLLGCFSDRNYLFAGCNVVGLYQSAI